MRGRARVALPVAAALLTTACLATQNDLRVLQGDVAVVRAEAMRADSVRNAQLNSVIAALKLATDTLRIVSTRLAKFQGDTKGEMFAMQQQLIGVQELTGQSQRRLQELRAGLEERTGVTTPGDSARGGGGGPGPNQLLQLALDQLRRGSAVSARAGFTDLLAQFPASEAAQLAQFYVGETYAAEGNSAAADSVYKLVVARLPASPKAPTALYKHALVLIAGGKQSEARAALNDVITKYPRSDEAVLAADRIKTLR